MSGLPQQPSIFGGETHRLSALTDGVFSIVMTLMVFNISLPKDRPSGNLTMALLGLWASFLAYGISFGLVGIYWSAHHSMFRFIQRTSHELVWLNIVFLAFVALVPFSTTLLAAHHSEPVALIVYGGNLILIGLSLLPLWWHATVDRRLVQRDLPDAVVRYGRSRILVGIIGYGLATVLALCSTEMSFVLFALVPLMYIVPPVQRAWLRFYGLASTPGAPESPRDSGGDSSSSSPKIPE